MDDRDKAIDAIYSALRGDGSMGTQAVANFMWHLLNRFGQEFTLQGAIKALDDLKESVGLMQEALRKVAGAER